MSVHSKRLHINTITVTKYKTYSLAKFILEQKPYYNISVDILCSGKISVDTVQLCFYFSSFLCDICLFKAKKMIYINLHVKSK